MPLGRKHLRRSRDAPTGGWALQRTTSRLGCPGMEVNVFDACTSPLVPFCCEALSAKAAEFSVVEAGIFGIPHPPRHDDHPKNTAINPIVSMNPWASTHTHKFRPDRMYAAPRISPAIPESTIPDGP